jgi:hypothetical protein
VRFHEEKNRSRILWLRKADRRSNFRSRLVPDSIWRTSLLDCYHNLRALHATPAVQMPAVTFSAQYHLLGSANASHPRPSAPRGVRHHEHTEHALYENNNTHAYLQSGFQRALSSPSHSFSRNPPSPSRMLGYLPAPSGPSPWSQNAHPPPPPPPIAHKVWILDCRSCGIFLTNRGMKVTTAK